MPSDLNFSAGSILEARQLHALADLMRDVLKSRVVSGRGTRLVHLPDGVLARVEVNTSTSVQHAFMVRASDGSAGAVQVRIGFGTVEGLEPVIGDRHISEADKVGEVPFLTVSPKQFTPRGNSERAFIYLRYTLSNPGAAVVKVEPFAAPKKPDSKPWIWNKLLCILVREDKESPVTVIQQLFFNQRFALTDLKGGSGTPWPWANP